VARQKLDSLNCYFLYFPLDLYWVVHRAVKLIGATLFVLVETDLWPNLLWCLAKQRTPVVLVNGRLSDRSFPRYRLLRRFFGGVLSNINTFCMQSQEDARRLRLLGIERAKIQVTGNLKFDQPLKKTVSHERNQLMSELGWTPPSLTWIAGSTHPGEEAIILRTYGRLRQRFADLCLILAPRNPERFTEVFQLAEQGGWQTVRRSQLLAGKPAPGPMDVLLLDTIGELASFYSLGQCAFLGGSLVPFGGHNPLEAAQRGLPVAFGPHMENFREIAAILQKSGGGIQVADENGLFERVEAWLAAPETCREQGKNAQEAVLIHQGALARSLEVIRSMLGAGKVS
ncbi:MAG: glycosyltransferase N-terminal domain-containing protein, partial [Syntrophobacterales bacterium]